MDRWIERLSVGLAETTTRRGALARLGRLALGLGAGIAGLAGGPALASHCYLWWGSCGGCGSSHASGCGGAMLCSSTQCNTSAQCVYPCQAVAAWYCCCSHRLWVCRDCRCPYLYFYRWYWRLCICQPRIVNNC